MNPRQRANKHASTGQLLVATRSGAWRTIRFAAWVLSLHLLHAPVLSAGECDCKDEVKNARAEVTSSCSKIWSNDVCTLKEAGAGTGKVPLGTWQDAVYRHVPGNRPPALSISWPQGGVAEFYTGLRPQLKDLAYLERLIVVTLAGEVPPEFVGEVITLLRKNSQTASEAWTRKDRSVFRGDRAVVTVAHFCVYGEAKDLNFYINANPSGPCPVAAR